MSDSTLIAEAPALQQSLEAKAAAAEEASREAQQRYIDGDDITVDDVLAAEHAAHVARLESDRAKAKLTKEEMDARERQMALLVEHYGVELDNARQAIDEAKEAVAEAVRGLVKVAGDYSTLISNARLELAELSVPLPPGTYVEELSGSVIIDNVSHKGVTVFESDITGTPYGVAADAVRQGMGRRR